MATVVAIGQADDPRLAPFRNIRERDLVLGRHAFISEGEVVVRRVLAVRPDLCRLVLLSHTRASALALDITNWPAHAQVIVCPPAVMETIAGFPLHRGVLAFCDAPPDPGLAGLLQSVPGEAPVVVAVGISNHDNVGGIFRNAAAFGAAAVLLDATSCHPLYRKALRVSVGASATLPFSHGAPVHAILDALEAAGLDVLALTPSGPVDLAALPNGRRRALILGAEGPGLPPDVLQRAVCTRISMAAGFDSLNVATASGIALYLVTRQTARQEKPCGGSPVS